MTPWVWLIAALAGFVAIGVGAALLRYHPRAALSGNAAAVVTAWFATLVGPRLIGAALVAGGAIVVLLVLVLRP